MGARAIITEELPIETEDDIVELRQKVRLLAQEHEFDSFAVAALTTAASELGRNIWAHAHTGSALLEVVEDSEQDREGIRMVFSDEGPGIEDLNKALEGGYSTADTLGLGLSGSKRLVDEFEIQTEPGKGTVVRVVKWNRIS